MRTSRIALVFSLFVAVAVNPAEASTVSVPTGYAQTERQSLVPGVEYSHLSGDSPRREVNVAHIASDADVSLRVVLSNDQISEDDVEARFERTSSMCLRTNCLVAVNGGFGDLYTKEPLGGVVSGGEMLRSFNEFHHQLTIGPERQLSAGPATWIGEVGALELGKLSFSKVKLDGLNVDRADNQLILYTPAYGPRTHTNEYGSELVLTPADPFVLGYTVSATMSELQENRGGTAIPPNGAVLSGHGLGAQVVQSLWQRFQSGETGAKLFINQISLPGEIYDSLDGTPVLLKDGKQWFDDKAPDNAGAFLGGAHPRTMVCWNKSGDTWLVTVDGRQDGGMRPKYSRGMPLKEAAQFLLELGCTDGLNLDGGGSTTFVRRGQVINRPSDALVKRGNAELLTHTPESGDVVLSPNVERPISSALVVIPKKTIRLVVPDPNFDLPAIPKTTPIAGDAGSVPYAAVPVAVTKPAKRPPLALAIVFALAVTALVAHEAGHHRLIRRLRRRR